MKKLSIPEQLSRNAYNLDEDQTHIEINQAVAKATGTAKLLRAVCPAGVYDQAADGTITIEYAACLECGTCRAVAPPGALTWHYPRGGFGIQYREG